MTYVMCAKLHRSGAPGHSFFFRHLAGGELNARASGQSDWRGASLVCF